MKACIYDGDNKVIEGFYVFDVDADAPSRVIGAPIESGQISFDNKVRDPLEITVKGTIVLNGKYEYTDILNKLNKMIDQRGFSFYKVCDGADIYDHLVLKTKKLNRNVDKYDFANITLQYVEAMLVQNYEKTPANSDNTDTRNSGNIDGETVDLDSMFMYKKYTW